MASYTLFLVSFCCVLFTVLPVIESESNDNPDKTNKLTTQLLDRLNALEERDREQQRLNANLRRELELRDKTYKDIIENLQTELLSQKLEIQTMKRSLSRQKQQTWKLFKGWKCSDRCGHQREEKLNASKERQLRSQGNNKPHVRQTEIDMTTVAFSAGLDNRVTNIGANQNIIFDRVETNIGNGYNPHHGIFVAPVTGTYVLFTSIYASHDYGHTSFFCHLVINGARKYAIYAEGASSASDTGSQMLIVKLSQGDDVAVQVSTPIGNILGTGDWTVSTFSGFLLQGDLSDQNAVIG